MINHDTLIKQLISYFDSQGFKIVTANYGEFKRCEKIGSHKPDIIAYHMDDDIYNIGLVKTCNELDDEDTFEELEDLANAVINKIGHERDFIPLCIAIPKECMKKLHDTIKEIGLSLNGNIQPLGF